MNERSKELEEDNDARINLLYRIDKIRTLVIGFRDFHSLRMGREAVRRQSELLGILEEMKDWFS